MRPAVLLDLDGTLVDSVYLHVVAWHRALAEHGHEVPMWRILAGIGMGSYRLLPWLLGADPDGGAEISSSHTRRILERADELEPTPGALELLEDLEHREVPFVVATSAGDDERAALLDALGRPGLDTVGASDVASSKPAPQLLEVASEQLGADPDEVTLVGDSPWDAEAGRRLGIRTIAVRTGGFGDDVLRRAGAIEVVDAPRALVGRL
jgi:HAD superfamily hydrolase (TIGR01509 family)